MVSLERVNWRCLVSGIVQPDIVSCGPVFVALMKQILTLNPWRWVVAFVLGPIKLLLAALELRQLLTVNTEHLVAELLSHVRNHFFDSVFLESASVLRYSIEAFERKAEYAVFAVFNPGLAVHVRIEVSLALLELLDEFLLPRVLEVALPGVFDPLKSRIRQFVGVDVCVLGKLSASEPILDIFFLLNLRDGGVLGVLDVFLGAVVVFELNLLKMSDSLVLEILLLLDVLLLSLFAEFKQFGVRLVHVDVLVVDLFPRAGRDFFVEQVLLLSAWLPGASLGHLLVQQAPT